MGVVDLHNTELLQYLFIDFDLLRLKWWNNSLTNIDGQEILEANQRFDFFVGL